MTDTKIEVREDRDLGLWFEINGVSIKNQPQLDYNVVSLASFYGLNLVSQDDLETIYSLVSETDERDLPDDLIEDLITLCELCTRYLNTIVERGYQFTFTGDDYSRLELVKVI